MGNEDGMRLGELEGIVGEEDGYSAESDAAVLLQGLDIPDSLHERKIGKLQGGQKMRVLLAQALFGQLEALLLDEPTNHLDLESINALTEVAPPLTRERVAAPKLRCLPCSSERASVVAHLAMADIVFGPVPARA